ncbi:LOW QUALITY PROTEIN: protein N-terminal asparagine amidohydrolase-like [Ctenodactylus gundi]
MQWYDRWLEEDSQEHPPLGVNGATCLTHCDGTHTKAEDPRKSPIVNFIKSFSHHTQCGRLEVHLVGGFSDDRQLSQKLAHQLLSESDKQENDTHLVTLYVTELNDREENENHFPVIYGTAVYVKTAEISKASCQVRPRGVALYKNLSTSPLAEPPHFVEHIRSPLIFKKKYPSPMNTLFPGNKALLYKKMKMALWEKISSPGS